MIATVKALVGLVLIVFCVGVADIHAQGDRNSHKSASKGRLVSLGTTFGPMIVGSILITSGEKNDNDEALTAGWLINLSAMTFGPGAGHLYAHSTGHFVGGSAIRGLCITAGMAGLAVAFASAFDFDKGDDDELGNGGVAVFLAGGALWLGYSIYDIARVGKSVNEYNAKQDRFALSASPFYRPHDNAIGLSVSMRF